MIPFSGSYSFDAFIWSLNLVFHYRFMLEFGNSLLLWSWNMVLWPIWLGFGNFVTCSPYGFLLASPLFLILLYDSSLFQRRNRAVCYLCFVHVLIIRLLIFRLSHVFTVDGGFWLSPSTSLLLLMIISRSFYCLDYVLSWFIHALLFVELHISCMQWPKCINWNWSSN